MNFSICSEQRSFCKNPIRKDIPLVYLTINPISTVSWIGKITQRQLVMNWKWASSGKTNHETNRTGIINDSIALFHINVSSLANLKGKLCRLIFHQMTMIFVLLLYQKYLPRITFYV